MKWHSKLKLTAVHESTHKAYRSDRSRSVVVIGWVLNLSDVFLLSAAHIYLIGRWDDRSLPFSLLQGTSVTAGGPFALLCQSMNEDRNKNKRYERKEMLDKLIVKAKMCRIVLGVSWCVMWINDTPTKIKKVSRPILLSRGKTDRELERVIYCWAIMCRSWATYIQEYDN